jgi:hypothetical protein
VASIKRLLKLCVLVLWLGNQYARSRSLGLARLSDLRTALDIDVGNIFLFAEDGQVRQHVDGRDVGRDDHQASGALADRLDGLFDASVDQLVLHALLDELYQFFVHFVRRQRVRNRTHKQPRLCFRTHFSLNK